MKIKYITALLICANTTMYIGAPIALGETTSETISVHDKIIQDHFVCLQAFKEKVIADPDKTADFLLSLDDWQKKQPLACRIIEYLPLDKKIPALHSLLIACKDGKIEPQLVAPFFDSVESDYYKDLPPNMQMAYHHYVPDINNLYQTAKITFAGNKELEAKFEDILSGEYRHRNMADCCIIRLPLRSIPFIAPHKGYWASLPMEKSYSYDEQVRLIQEYAKALDKVYLVVLDLAHNRIAKEQGIKLLNESIDQLEMPKQALQKLRPIKNDADQANLLLTYLDELTVIFLKRVYELNGTIQNEELEKLFGTLNFKMLTYPDCYLLEWIMSQPLPKEGGPKLKQFAKEQAEKNKLAEEYKK